MSRMIFISYRRDDSKHAAGRVRDRLRAEFGSDLLLFIDVEAIPLGANFTEVVREAVDECDVLLAVIGSEWLDASDGAGQRRLDNPNDLVRIEIATALARKILVMPILLDGTRMPRAEQLPEDLRELSDRNALDVRHGSFDADMSRIICELKCVAGVAPTGSPQVPYGIGGKGGDAKVSGRGAAIGGRGGAGGVPEGGRGGGGGSAEVVGDGFALGGEGGEAGQADRGGRGGRSPLEVLEEMGLANESTRLVLLITKLREEYMLNRSSLSPSVTADGEQIPEEWINRRLEELGMSWRVRNKDNGFEIYAARTS